ncbi:MAG: CoA transferase [Desulfobacterales bacterium]
MSKSALEGIKVLEFATMVSGPYCGKLLADMGAEVIKIEPPAGDPARLAGPFPEAKPDTEKSALFLYNNTSKRGVVLDLDRDEDKKVFKQLVAWADVLIDNHPAHVLEDAGFGWEAIQRINHALVYTSITPYGRFGPRADDWGDELTVDHAGGVANLIPARSADVNRAPCKTGGYQVGCQGGIAAAIATLAAVIRSRESGKGSFVDISLQDVIMFLVSPIAMGSRYYDSTWSRVPDRPPAMGRMQTSDGYVILAAADDHHFRILRKLMGNPEWAASDEWDDMYYRNNHLMEIAPHMDEWMLKQEMDEIHHRAAKAGIPIGPISSAKDVMESPQYKSRDYFVEVDHPVAGAYRYAGWSYKMTATPARVSRPAPLLGQHTDEITDDSATFSQHAEEPPSPEADKGPGKGDAEGILPLAGIRVLDFAWVFAGPYSSMFLASLGAEVIKIEGHNRSDLMRRSITWPLADPAPTQRFPNQGTGFLSANMNKKGITLDISKPEGKEIARRLVETSDVVLDNMRPGAMDKLGLGYEDLKKIRPDLIVLSASREGRSGPESNYLGFASIHYGYGGGAYITGYPDDHPTPSSPADVDLMNAMVAAYSVLSAIYHRKQTGEGQFIDLSQCESVSGLIGEALLGYEMTSEIPERMGNAHPVLAPHNAYKCWGVDRWLALEIHSDGQFADLAGVMGQPELATDPKFEHMTSRKENEKELDTIIESWTELRDRDWMVRAFSEAGLMAAPSRDWKDLYADPHLKARGAFVSVDHPEMGPIDVARPPWIISDCPMPTRCAPMLGQHNDSVFKDILGLRDDEIAALEENDIIANNWPHDRFL